MRNTRRRSQLAGSAAAGLLIALLAGPALPATVLAANRLPAHATPLSRIGRSAGAGSPASRGRIDAAALIARRAPAPPFSRVTAGHAVERLRAGQLAARRAATARAPQVTLPPAPAADPWQSSGAPAPAVTAPGVGGHQPLTGVEPADGSTAIGLDQAIEAVNGTIFIANRSGALLDNQAIATPTFFNLPEPAGGAAYQTFDSAPRVAYDATLGRWFASEVSWDCATNTFVGDTAAFGHGHIEFAISDGVNALDHWTLGTISFVDQLPDLPTFGMSTDKLAFTADTSALQAGGGPTDPGCLGGSSSGEALQIIDLAELAPGFTSWHPFAITFPPQFVWFRPVLQQPVSSPDMRFIGAVSMANPLDVAYVVASGSARANTIDGNLFDLSADGIVPPFLDPGQPSQPGPGTIAAAVDASPTGEVWHDGLVAITSTYPCTPAGDSVVRDCVRIISLAEPAGYLEPTRYGDVLLGSNGLDQYQAAIAFAGSGVLHAVYTASSVSVAPSGNAQYHARYDPWLAWSDPQLVVAGSAAYAGSQWGDYSMAGQDPQDPNRIWVSPEYTTDSGAWATSFSSISATHGAGFSGVDPTRLIDSRLGVGLSGPLTASIPRLVHLPISGPTSVVAVTGNLTVTGATAAGFVTLSPDPSSTNSSINFRAGDTRANNVTVPLGPAGTLVATYHAPPGATAQLIFDATGTYDEGSGDGFHPISPVRVLNTRTGLGAATFHANVAQSFVVAGTASIPADATAISANLTVVGQTIGGYVAVTRDATNNPVTSTLNFALGDTRSNGLIVAIGLNGTVSAVYKGPSGTANLILDVTGYYSAAPDGLVYHPLNPGRYVDTRRPLGPEGYINGLTGAQGSAPRSVQVNGHYGVSIDAQAVTGNLTVVGQTAAGFVTVGNSSVALPPTSTINFPLGDIRANGVNVPVDDTGNLWFVARTSGGGTVQLVFDLSGYFEAPAP
jgi:hypothetical protein